MSIGDTGVAATRSPRRTYALIGGSIAVLTFLALLFWPVVSGGPRYGMSPVGKAAGVAFIALFLGLIPMAFAAFDRSAAAINAMQVHLALLASLTLLSWLTTRPGHSSLGDSLVWQVYGLVFVVIVVELAVLWGAWAMCRQDDRPAAHLLPGLLAAVLGGFFVGAFFWAATVPAVVLNAAGKVARDRPYCLYVVGKPATSTFDLTGFRMVAPTDGNYTWSFHGLMVVDDGRGGEELLNWSYRAGDFRRLPDGFRGSGTDVPPCAKRRDYVWTF